MCLGFSCIWGLSAEYFTCHISSNPHNNPVKQKLDPGHLAELGMSE